MGRGASRELHVSLSDDPGDHRASQSERGQDNRTSTHTQQAQSTDPLIASRRQVQPPRDEHVTIPMNAVSSLFSATSAADAYAQLAAVAGDPDALAAACKALTPRAFADATKHAPAVATLGGGSRCADAEADDADDE